MCVIADRRSRFGILRSGGEIAVRGVEVWDLAFWILVLLWWLGFRWGVFRVQVARCKLDDGSRGLRDGSQNTSQQFPRPRVCCFAPGPKVRSSPPAIVPNSRRGRPHPVPRSQRHLRCVGEPECARPASHQPHTHREPQNRKTANYNHPSAESRIPSADPTNFTTPNPQPKTPETETYPPSTLSAPTRFARREIGNLGPIAPAKLIP
jgi:hypothetical protein